MQALWVDRDETRRTLACKVALARNIGVLEAPDAFAAMGALGRADFDALVVVEEPRVLSMRGLLMLARKRHAGIKLFVLVSPSTVESGLRPKLGVPVECVPWDTPLETLLDLMSRQVAATPMPFSVPRTSAVDLAVQQAQAEVLQPMPAMEPPPHSGFAVQRVRTEPPPPPPPTSSFTLEEPPTTPTETDPAALAPVHLEGDLARSSGSALLLGLLAQQLTGRLVVDAGPAEGVLYLLRGEPVYAVDPSGDAGLWDRCLKANVVRASMARPHVPEGQLSSVVASMVDGEALHNIFRALVRDRVLALAGQHEGGYSFDEDRAFLDVVPLYKVSPVALVVEAMRRWRSPDKLLERARTHGNHYLHAGPGLAAAAPRLVTFFRGHDPAALVDGTRTVTRFFDDTELGPTMGMLMVEVLLDAGLVSLRPGAHKPNASDVVLRATLPAAVVSRPAGVTARLPDADVEQATSTDGRARNQIFALYARLKPLRLPRQVLGVPAFADRAAIDEAYQRLMTALDAQHIPEGSARALLQSRIDEIRHKVTGSYQALLLELSPDGGTDSNPF